MPAEQDDRLSKVISYRRVSGQSSSIQSKEARMSHFLAAKGSENLKESASGDTLNFRERNEKLPTL